MEICISGGIGWIGKSGGWKGWNVLCGCVAYDYDQYI